MINLINANSLKIPLAAKTVHMVACSPPYFNLRDYGVSGQLGNESVHDCLAWAIGNEPCGACFVCNMRSIGREVWRVLRDDGVWFLNLGDSYASGPGGKQGATSQRKGRANVEHQARGSIVGNLKQKDLAGIPWRVALALQADGYYLRSDIIWAKTNPMPESVTDRPTKAHEYIFMLTKSERYFYDQGAIREAQTESTIKRAAYGWNEVTDDNSNGARSGSTFKRMAETGELIGTIPADGSRNKRTVWTIPTTPFPGAHFACWPPALVEPMIKAGTSERGCCSECGAQWERVTERGNPQMRPDNPNPVIPYTADGMTYHGTGATTLHMTREVIATGWQPTCTHTAEPIPCTVLDPFAGSGTTGLVARRLGRRFIGLDLSFNYLKEQAKTRLSLSDLEDWNNGNATGANDYDSIMSLPLFATPDGRP